MGNKAHANGPKREAFLLNRLLLRLGEDDEDLIGELSAVARTPDGAIWVGSDELMSVERLEPESPGVYGARERYGLRDLVELPSDGEVDIEGMDFDGGYLWVAGSHSLKRGKADGDEDDEDAIDALATLERDENRFLLARVPIVDGEPFRRAERGDDARTAASLPLDADTSALVEALAEDPHIGPFLSTPSKDNGLDVEGIAVRDGVILLGLRGPVLGGWAIVLELRTEESGPGRLELVESGEGRSYYKHFAHLGGLGVRELCWHGDDLLLLAGPTMDHEGAMKVWRMPGGPKRSGDTITRPGKRLELLFDLPIALGGDHAEGLTIWPGFRGETDLLVVYDDPKPERVIGGSAVYADIWRL